AYDGRGVLVKRIAARQPGTTKGDSAVTTYTYANNARVTKVDIQADSAGGQLETTVITPWDDRTVSAPVQADSLGPATRVDGPIAGIGDAVDILVGAFGQPVRMAQLGLGTVTRIGYDSSQTLPALATEVRYPHPTTAGGVGRIVRLSWNDRGNLVQQRDSTAHLGSIGGPTDSTTYTYGDADAPDSPSLLRNGAGQTLAIAYNGLGLADTTTDQRGHVTGYSYTTSGAFEGQVQTITELNVPVWSESVQAIVTTSLPRRFTYDASGNLRTDSLPSGIRYSYVHDNTGAVKDTYDPLNMRRRFAYDALGRVVQDSLWTAPQMNPYGDPLVGCSAAWFTCAMGDSARPVNTGIPSVLVTTYVHSPVGLVSVSDPRQVQRSWRHDARGNVVAAIDDYGNATRALIGVDGLLNAVVQRTSDSVNYTHDAIGRRTSLRYPPLGAGPYGTIPGDTITYTYDKLGQLTEADQGGATVKRSWYANGTLASEVSVGDGYDSLGYRYDVLGRRTVRVHQDMTGTKDSVRYTYGSTGDLDSLIVKWGGPTGFTTPRVFRYTWDALGQRANIHYPLTGGMDVSYAYDAVGTLRQVLVDHPQHSTTPPELADSFSLRRPVVDPTGRVLYERTWCPDTTSPASPCPVAHPEESNTFNTLGWLVRQARTYESASPGIDSLRYDASGNIIWRNNNNPYGGDTLVIATGHNRVERMTSPLLSDLHLSYQADGSRLFEWRDSSAYNAPGQRAYYYDGLGRPYGTVLTQGGTDPDTIGTLGSCVTDPVGRQVRPCNSGLLLGLDGENIVRSQDWSIASGPGLDDPMVALFRRPGYTPQELYYITDGQGRHLLATQVGGGMDEMLATTGTYADWRATGAASVASGYGANRLSTDQAPGLAFYRNRIYDQATGRWTQEDPLGVAGGLNLYQFNGNDPVTFTDPFGLCVPMPWCLLVGAGAGGGTVVLGEATATISVGAAATVAAPVVVAAGLVGWASLPVHPVATHQVSGALVQSDATAVTVPAVHAMGKVSRWIGHIGMAVTAVLNPGHVQQGDHTDTGTGQMTQPAPKGKQERKNEDEGGGPAGN
ncbi:MAG TPA: RHS repeat-associated core domain-containing protein, partial [Candidatus Tectomicrobia bacterium]|nr:RHS repeat-associated core domain-containing protein [Candidatus Tectomicrobia bacterium]